MLNGFQRKKNDEISRKKRRDNDSLQMKKFKNYSTLCPHYQWCAALNFSRSRNAPDCNRKSSVDFRSRSSKFSRSRFSSLVSNLISIFFEHHLKEGQCLHLQTTDFWNFHQKFYFVVHSKYNQPSLKIRSMNAVLPSAKSVCLTISNKRGKLCRWFRQNSGGSAATSLQSR